VALRYSADNACPKDLPQPRHPSPATYSKDVVASAETTQVHWPAGLERPEPGPLLVYLDLNHWIGLAKAAKGHREGFRYADALAACREAIAQEKAIFPLSGVHYMEVSKIERRARRSDLAAIMMELSRFNTLIGRAKLLDIEREAAIDAVALPRVFESEPWPYLAWGVMHCLGRTGALKLGGSPETMQQIPDDLVKRIEAQAQLRFEYVSLAGPQNDTEQNELEQRGWEPAGSAKVAEERAQAERDQVKRFDEDEDEHHRRKRLHDVVYAREVVTELEALNKSLESRPPLAKTLLASKEQFDAMLALMPSLTVTIELKVGYHRNPQTKWTSNAIFDIDAMSVAVPYCDIVAADNQVRSVLRQAKLHETMDTDIISSPDQLVQLLTHQ
jgi:hypothetical protein